MRHFLLGETQYNRYWDIDRRLDRWSDHAPPGTGKTRLVRAILAASSARKADSAQVLYTADMRALENALAPA